MRTLAFTALLCCLAIVAAGCGDDNNSDSGSSGSGQAADTQTTENGGGGGGGGGAAQTLKLSADPGGALKFDKSSLTAKAGKVTITLDNPSSIPHAVEIEGHGVEEESGTIGEGETTKVTATVKPGEYEYYCPVDGHKAAGMTGTLTVQ
jgi:plastocyanin